jgi:hypothetical protein
MKTDSAISTGPNSTLPPDTQHQDSDKRQRQRHYNRPLKIRRLPIRHGWYWLIEGFLLWTRNPAFLSFLVFSCILAIIVAAIPDYVGELLAMILYPGMLLGVFNGCRAIDRKRNLSPGLLISGFRRHAFDLLLAGFYHFIVMAAILSSTWLIDGGMMWQVLIHGEIPDMAAFASPPLFYSLILVGVLSTIWTAVYLFVPQLIGWWRLSVPNALIHSLKGCLINCLPLFAYAFCFSFFVILLSALVINFLALTVEGLGTVVCVVFLLIIAPTLIASFYVAARDIFGFPRRKKRRQQPGSTPDERKKRRVRTA